MPEPMKLNQSLARMIRAAYTGGNATGVCLQEALEGVSWQQATTSLHGLNPIALLVFHMNYYLRAVTRVLEGGPLDARDKYSFDLPPLNSEGEWEQLKEKTFQEAEVFAQRVEQLSPEQLDEPFADGKYGTIYRNVTGVMEHMHYHLGQVVLIKKMLEKQNIAG